MHKTQAWGVGKNTRLAHDRLSLKPWKSSSAGFDFLSPLFQKSSRVEIRDVVTSNRVNWHGPQEP